MDFKAPYVINDFLAKQQQVFTADDFQRQLKVRGVKLTKSDAQDILTTSDMVFTLVDNEFVTRAGVFTGRWFSFKPSKEEISKNRILLGHRCMPFVNPEVPPEFIKVKAAGKEIKSGPAVFSMNLALDVFALYGEGYVLPYIFNDHSNTKYPLSSVQYGMPKDITLTSWPLDALSAGHKFTYGDRFLCRVVDWASSEVEFFVKPASKSEALSAEDLEREEWYSDFENGLLESFEKNGPGDSIEQQLAYLFLENQENLCIRNCGSAEEFLSHTKRIGFAPYGVESRIWKLGEDVPYIGVWNNHYAEEYMSSNMSMLFSPYVIDAYLENYIHNSIDKPDEEAFENLVNEIFPVSLKMTDSERHLLLLNMQKRRDIIIKSYNQFADHRIAGIRQRVIELFTQVNSLLCSIGCSGLKLDDFPQQELVILVQLFSHIIRVIEEMETDYLKDSFPVDDFSLSLDGMSETFEEISESLRVSLDVNTYKNIRLL